MKKAAKVVFILVLALCLGYYAYATYQHSASFKGAVHQNAGAVIKIGVQDIKETLVLDALGAPRYYIEKMGTLDDSDDGETSDKPDKGIDLLSHNLLAFTMPNCPNTVFAVFNIDDKQAFEAYIKKKFGEKLRFSEKAGTKYSLATIGNGKFVLGWNIDKLVVAAALKIDQNAVKTVFEDLLVRNKFINDMDHPLLKSIKKTKGHVVYADAKGLMELTLKDGKAVIKGNRKTELPFTGEIAVPLYQNTSFSMHYDYSLENASRRERLHKWLTSTPFFKKNGLEVDSIVKHLNGSISFAVNGRAKQNDTVITYAYNDNFEKVEQKTVQEKTVPQLHLNLGADPKGLVNYLDSTQVLTSQHIFKPFPLYQVRLRKNTSDVTLSTNLNRADSSTKRSAYFFQLKANFEKLQHDLAFAKTAPLFSLLTHLEVHAWQEKANGLSLEGELKGKKDNINIVSQLFFGLNGSGEPKAGQPEL